MKYLFYIIQKYEINFQRNEAAWGGRRDVKSLITSKT